jgi:tetratricopeptide (TPR) repeat protein
VIEALKVCDRAIELADRQGKLPHPAIVHLHIHALEMSNEPQRAMRSADALLTMCPDAGHMNHMPGHVYMLCGNYQMAKSASEKAIVADDMYLAYAGPLTFYTIACAHDLHLMMYTCTFMGRYKDSIDAANKMCRLLSRDVLSVKGRPKFAMSLEGYYSMKTHVMVRFGRWQEIIDEPLQDDPDLYPVTTAMQHYAKGIAHAALRRFCAAHEERLRFYECLRRIAPARRFFNNPAHAILAVGAAMLEGEVEYHKGNYDVAFAHLREAVRRDDNLEYIEPWAWMHPPRHALAALLTEQGNHGEAEQIYRDDLGLSGKIQRCAQHPNNVWALHGLVECLGRRREEVELPSLQKKLAAAMALADVPITSSCMCRTKAEPSRDCCS